MSPLVFIVVALIAAPFLGALLALFAWLAAIGAEFVLKRLDP